MYVVIPTFGVWCKETNDEQVEITTVSPASRISRSTLSTNMIMRRGQEMLLEDAKAIHEIDRNSG